MVPGSNMNKLIFANLLHRPMRSVISVLAVAIEVIMILSIVAIFMGYLDSQKDRTNGIGADLLLMPSNASMFNGLGSPSMPIRDQEVLVKLPHVAVVSPAIQKISTSGNVEILYGIDYDSFDALKPFRFLDGSKFQGPNDVIIDEVLAGTRNPATGKPYAVGDSITILSQPFRISGIVAQGKGGRKLIPLETMGALMGADGKASMFYIKCDNPANDNAVMDEIRSTRGFGNNTLVTVDSWLDQMTPDKIPGFNLSLEVITGIARDHWFPRHLPVHVHRGSGANPGDRHSEIHGRFQNHHRERGASRVRGFGRCRRCGGDTGNLWRAAYHGSFPPDADVRD